MPRSPTIPPFSMPGGLAGLARGLDGWPSMEDRAAHVVDLIAAAPRQRTRPAVLLVQLLAHATVRRGSTPAPAGGPPALLRALASVLGVEKHATRAAVLAGPLSNTAAADALGLSERTVRRARAEGVAPALAFNPIELADRYALAGKRRAGVAEALYDLAAGEVESGTYFSTPLLWALAEVLGVARRDSGLTRGATEVLHNGLRDPEAFIAAGIADGRAALERAGADGAHRMLSDAASRSLDDTPEPDASSVNALAAEVGATRDSVRRWRGEDSPQNAAYELNRLQPAAFARFNAGFKGRK